MSGQIYEYLCVDIGGREADKRTELLNEYAADGWELVNAGVWWAYFRRVSIGSATDEFVDSVGSRENNAYYEFSDCGPPFNFP